VIVTVVVDVGVTTGTLVAGFVISTAVQAYPFGIAVEDIVTIPDDAAQPVPTFTSKAKVEPPTGTVGEVQNPLAIVGAAMLARRTLLILNQSDVAAATQSTAALPVPARNRFEPDAQVVFPTFVPRNAT
jgi:hypothetical protein